MNHGIHRIHGMVLLAVAALGTSLTSFAADPGITVSARQRYPWNGLVDINFTITGTSGTKYDTSFTAKDMVGNTNIAMRTIRKADGTAAATKEQLLPGTYNWVWDAAADLPDGFQCDSVTVEVTAADLHSKVQLWEGGPYWATTNIGAENPEDYGYYFWWGDIVGYKRESNRWLATDGSSFNFSFRDENVPTHNKDIATLQSEGWTASVGILTPSHDAAHAHWGGSWRLPTKQELLDLRNKCTWTWTTTNSVSGYLVRGSGDYAANRIFLPCAVYGLGTSLKNVGQYGYYWSSVPEASNDDSWYLVFYAGYRSISHGSFLRYYGLPVRPVQGGAHIVNVTFDANGGTGATEISVLAGEQLGTLPTASRDGHELVGWFTAVDGGTRVTASTVASLDVTYYAHWTVVHGKVQLWEEGPFWATTNIGAENPEDYGYYFWWGGTVGYKRENEKWVASDGSVSNFSFCTGNTWTYGKDIATLTSEGWIASDGCLAPSHDAAQAHWGGDWRLPSKQELVDLNSKCDWVWSSLNGTHGYVVRGKGEYSSASVFLPAAGQGGGLSRDNSGLWGCYWSSVPDVDYSYELFLYQSKQSTGGYLSDHSTNIRNRACGQSVRPVKGSGE